MSRYEVRNDGGLRVLRSLGRQAIWDMATKRATPRLTPVPAQTARATYSAKMPSSV